MALQPHINILITFANDKSTQMDAFDSFLDNKNYAGLLSAAKAAIAQDEKKAQPWAAMSLALYGMQKNSQAIIAMSKAVNLGLLEAPLSEKLRAALTQDLNIYLSVTQAIGEHDPRAAEISKYDPLFGSATEELTTEQERLMGSILEAKAMSWELGETPYPPYALRFKDQPIVDKKFKIYFIAAENIDWDASKMRSDVADAIYESAIGQGHEVRWSKASNELFAELVLRDGQQKDVSVLRGIGERIKKDLEDFLPDIVLLERNLEGGKILINEYIVKTLKLKGKRLVVFIADLYDKRETNVLDFWADISDAVIYLNEKTTLQVSSKCSEVGLYWPCLPFSHEMFHQMQKKYDINITGFNNLIRSRDLFMNCFKRTNLDGHLLLHDRTQQQALKMDDYRKIMAQSRVTFNNGRLTNLQHIVTGRCLEIIYSRSLLLEESGSDMNMLFVPYVHYIPFSNAHQAIAWTQYMKKHTEQCEQMVAAAFDWAVQHYRPEILWSVLFRKLGLS